jgi:hypothetical protein
MNDLLDCAVEAHGGLAAWNAFTDLELGVSIGGAIWEFKQNPGLLQDVTYHMKTHEERLTITGFSAPDRRISFVPQRLTLETLDGNLIESRDDPRASFAGQTAATRSHAKARLHGGYLRRSDRCKLRARLPHVPRHQGTHGSADLCVR